MFLVVIANLDGLHQEHCVRSVFDLEFPLWFYALVILAGLLLMPWFHLIGCIIFNWLYGHRSANKTMMPNKTTFDWNVTLNTKATPKTGIKRTIIKQSDTDDNMKSTLGHSSYCDRPTSARSTDLIKQRGAVHLEHRSVCDEAHFD